MRLLDRFEIKGLGLYLSAERLLILGDMHIGYDEALNRAGVLIPRFHFKELLAIVQDIVREAKPKAIVVNGDIKHEFGTISDEEWRNILKMIDYLQSQAELFIIKGNHDAVLQPIAAKRKIQLIDHYSVGDIYICHGHEVPKDKDFAKAKMVVMGHEHPAITLDDGIKREKYKCFLVGKYNKKDLIVMPSLNPVQAGSDILSERLLSPLIKRIKDFDVIVVEDKPYFFGKVRQFF